LLSFVKGCGIFQQYFSELRQYIDVLGVEGQGFLQMLNTSDSIAVSNVDPSQTEVSPWRRLVEFNSFLEHFRSILKVLLLLEAFADLKINLKVVWIDLGALLI